MSRFNVSLPAGDDRGATAILIAFSMLLLLGFAAVALDAAGLGFNERRQNQSAADVGALAAVQFASPVDVGHPECSGLSGISMSRCNGAVEAREVANATLDDPSLAVWTDSTKCGSPPAGYTTASTVSDCIAFNANNQRAWVRVPTVDKPTSIARAVGLNSVSTTAEAIAGTIVNPPGGVLPFLLPGIAASSDYECLKAFPNPDFGPCQDTLTSGNFGSADFFLYGDLEKGWSTKCSGDTNGRLVANIARGTDHPLSSHPTGIGAGIEEAANCPDFGAQPNMVDSQTGVGSNLETGLLYGGTAYSTTAYPGKIEVPDGDPNGYLARNGGGSTDPAWVDNLPLWNYLLPGLSFPCNKADVDTPLKMEACIVDAKSTGTVIFDDTLVDSLRFGWVPQLWESTFTGNPYHIELYRPVFLDTTWYGCSSNVCDIMHTPGVMDTGACPTDPPDVRITCGTAGDKNDSLQAVTAWILDRSIVPDNAKTPPPGSENQRSYNLID